MLFEGRDDEVLAVCEDTAPTILHGGANPASSVSFVVLLPISVLTEEKHLFAFPRRDHHRCICKDIMREKHKIMYFQ